MNRITFARWEIESDPVATRDLYSRLPSGAAEACGCLPCLNFATSRKLIYPADVIRLFDGLGIAHNREAEVYHTHRIEPGRHHYGGWFHFVGAMVSGADALMKVWANMSTLDLEKISEEFQLGFTDRLALLKDPFKRHPVVQLEFQAAVP